MPGGSAAAAGLSGCSPGRLCRCQRGAAAAATGELAAPQRDGRAAQGLPAGPKEGQTTGNLKRDRK